MQHTKQNESSLSRMLLDILGTTEASDYSMTRADHRLEQRMLIDGKLVLSKDGKTFAVIDPASAETLGNVADGGEEELSQAISAARRAFDTTDWSVNHSFRAECLRQLQQAMSKHAKELRLAVMCELGAPLRITRHVHVDRLIDKLGFFAQAAADMAEPVVLDPVATTPTRLIVRQAVGVVGAITPWNIPLDIPIAKVCGALAAGNTVVLKPAPDTPSVMNIVGRLIAEETDIPAGVINIVTSSDHALGKRLVEDPRVDVISFTGSTQTGSLVMSGAAPSLKRLHLELGGKSPSIVLDDCDLEKVVPVAAAMGCFNAGQSCILPSRLLVPAKHYKQCVELAAFGMSQVTVGDPFNPDSFMGPMVSRMHMDRVDSMIQQGLAAGGTLVTGGKRIGAAGFYYAPTLIADVTPDHPLVQNEIFGPAVVIQAYDDDEHAIQLANDVDFGLAAYIWSASEQRAAGLASRLQVGMVSINGGDITAADSPFGGMKKSGFGREWGMAGVEEFTECKVISSRSLVS